MLLPLTDELCSAVFSHLRSHTTISQVCKRFLTKELRDAAKARKRANAQAVMRETFAKLDETASGDRIKILMTLRRAVVLRARMDATNFNIYFTERGSNPHYENHYVIRDSRVYERMFWGGLVCVGSLADFVAKHNALGVVF